MKICMWNVRGANRNLFLPHAKEVVFNQNPDIFIFLETKADGSRARETMISLKFSDFRVVRPVGTRGGIWLFWKKTVDLVLFDAENTYFHSLFHFKNLGKEGLVTAMHAPSSSREKSNHWNSLQSNLPPKNTPWLVVGDMNEITSQSEKQGGRPFRVNQGKEMVNFMDEAGLVDLGFSGCPFTWTNARDAHHLIQERLDRALANSPWMEAYPHTKNLFTTTRLYGNLNCDTHSNLAVNVEEFDMLNSPVSIDEVRNNLFAMDPIKAPGPDGIQPIFFQKHWVQLGTIIFDFCNDCFLNGTIPEDINQSYITLIPKNPCPATIAEFRPIGLCNTIYKLVTKIISSRLKNILGRIISPFQSSFIHGRGIEDNVILVKEMAHHFHKVKKRNKIMALKLDITKAYDSIEWDFVRETLLFFNFPPNLISLIMSCISTPSISILWNGEICNAFKPSRGIRQGDPLSSYIFVLCLDRLSTIIEQKVNSHSWSPIAITRNIKISHVFYADDVFLFSTANKESLSNIMDALTYFGEKSGLKISMTKSTLIFPSNLHHSIRKDIAGDFGFKISSSFGKYLGVDIRPNKLKISNYLGLLDKSMDRVRGWQAKLLNMAGRCTLIKSVLNSYPLYAMQTNILPASITHALEKCFRKFLWNKVEKSRYMSRLSWDKITRPINEGGLGIRRFKEWNLAFMAKLGWAVLTNPDKLWVKVLKEKYLKHANLFNCVPNNNQSPLWRDILKGRSILEKGIIIGIGNGDSTSLWYHHWIGTQPLYKTEGVTIPDSKAHWLVSHIIRNKTWHLNDIEHLIPSHIKSLILSYPLSNNCKELDFIRWIYSKNGCFNIKSAYHCQFSTIHCPTLNNVSWRKIWKIPGPYKYKMLLWNCAHQILPVAESLHQFLPQISPTCSRCRLNSENHLHLFRDCPQSSILWTYIFQRVWSNSKFDFYTFYNSNWSAWITFNLNNSIKWKSLFITAIWKIWLSRNRVVFDLKMKSAFSLYNDFYVDWTSANNCSHGKELGANQVPGLTKKTWFPPKDGVMKLNVDDAWKSNAVAGGGGVFRRSTGSWFVGFSSKFTVSSPLAAELYALREGLIIARDFKFEKLEIETDALNLKVLLGKIKEQDHHELGPILREVANLLNQSWVGNLTHIPKFCNKVAHSLAAHSLIMAVGSKLHYIIPSCAKSDYEADFENANPEYVETIRRKARDEANSIVGGTSGGAAQLVFGSIVTDIKEARDKLKNVDNRNQDKGKGTAFTPFVVGGSTMDTAIEIVEVEEGEITNN
ncbi:uncharacterized protein [Spinacia oleracea]|uniref:Reverse transcriptase domain-containing protein n=1 Tax=Spinacia oleracea TaxID=3562 RepID=A0ABM3QZ81_SPIOL|nr:uncharacterized protein LOC130463556 [Spinacia oleracea]